MAGRDHGHSREERRFLELGAGSRQERPSNNDTCIETGKSADDSGGQVSERSQDIVALQIYIELEHECRQGRKTAAEANRKQQAILIWDNTRRVKPLGARNKMRQNAHGQATEQVRAERADWQCIIALQPHMKCVAGHRTQRAANGEETYARTMCFISLTQMLARGIHLPCAPPVISWSLFRECCQSSSFLSNSGSTI